jgi:trans-aconitate methyltransferase
MSYSDEYKKTLKELHQSKAFGNKSGIPQEVIDCIEKYQVTSFLDFGCGKGYFLQALKEKYPNIEIFGFDPANENFQTLPDKVDMIYSSDVLEHIEPEKLEDTILDLKSRCSKVMYHLIACHPAKRTMSDGRNAHLIIHLPDWWRKLLTLKLFLNIIQEKITQRLYYPKKGPAINVVKYIIIVEI